VTTRRWVWTRGAAVGRAVLPPHPRRRIELDGREALDLATGVKAMLAAPPPPRGGGVWGRAGK
jgi:hypothetical protein